MVYILAAFSYKGSTISSACQMPTASYLQELTRINIVSKCLHIAGEVLVFLLKNEHIVHKNTTSSVLAVFSEAKDQSDHTLWYPPVEMVTNLQRPQLLTNRLISLQVSDLMYWPASQDLTILTVYVLLVKYICCRMNTSWFSRNARTTSNFESLKIFFMPRTCDTAFSNLKYREKID